ncbi:hypothetical protein [Salinimicrobium flavum]|uniref:DoxX protein n=1 Tax=Salinimicrobium flavum TaxID=1737065 RepID=A0ABW5IZQ6_9FLAO
MKLFYDNYFRFRNNELLSLFVVNLRYIIGLGFLPSGIIKVLDQPFTHMENVGVFYDFLDALYATGYYYNMIGVMQVVAALLLITQRFATIGAVLFLPIIFNITVLTITTIGSLTPLVAFLMFLGTIFLLLWDYYKWINIFYNDNQLRAIPAKNNYPTYNRFQVWTGILLILFPSLFIGAGFPKTGLTFVAIVLVTGNLISEWKRPVLRPFLKIMFRKASLETDV